MSVPIGASIVDRYAGGCAVTGFLAFGDMLLD